MQVGLSMLLDIEQVVSHVSCCYGDCIQKLHPAFVFVFDLICAMGLLLSAFLVIPVAEFTEVTIVKEMVGISTGLASVLLSCLVNGC